MDEHAICIPCKRIMENDGYEVKFLKGRLFYPMTCIRCGALTHSLGTIVKVGKRKAVLVTV